MNANISTSTDRLTISDEEPNELLLLLTNFGNKSFLTHQAQGFEQCSLENAYRLQEESFLKTSTVVSSDRFPPG